MYRGIPGEVALISLEETSSPLAVINTSLFLVGFPLYPGSSKDYPDFVHIHSA
jgi:hypothetical protein